VPHHLAPALPPHARRSWQIDGAMALSPDGRATRVVRYQLPGAAGPTAYAAAGSFRLRGATVELALREEGAPRAGVWHLRATLSGDSLTVRYPHPADGETTELFVRQ
jgi:hypothetical protein